MYVVEEYWTVWVSSQVWFCTPHIHAWLPSNVDGGVVIRSAVYADTGEGIGKRRNAAQKEHDAIWPRAGKVRTQGKP